MGGWEKEKHQPEPWKVDGRHIVSASGWRLAKSVLLPDAQRIVAAVNDTQGIPNAALEAGFIRDLLELKVWPRAVWEGQATRLQLINAADIFLHEHLDPPDPFSVERRVGDRRRIERRRKQAAGG